MARLLMKNASHIVTCDPSDTVYTDSNLLMEDGVITYIGPEEQQAEEVIDAAGCIVYPGLINTHHHLYQTFSRNLPQVQNLELFDWLKALYEIWKNLDSQVIYHSSVTGMGELMKNGCTTCFDHHYVFPQGQAEGLLDAQFAAAEDLGIRMYASRGSMDLSKKDGGLPPDSVVQTVDEILRDCQRAVEAYHDPSRFSMRMVALAPCSPFSVSEELLRQSAILARDLGVRLHTHLCETKDEERFVRERCGMRPLEYMESLGWIGPDVWYAHGIHFNGEELRRLAETGTGVAHCPISNMKLSSGVCRVPDAQVGFYGVIPLKAKWLAWADIALMAWNIARSVRYGAYASALAAVVAILNFVIFFWEDIKSILGIQSRQRSRQTIQFKSAVRQQKKAETERGYRHKCEVCGRTDADHPELEFRYCSKCQGYHCFCSDHIFNHQHFTK